MDSNDIYVQDNPANGDFDFEVAGIGRIDTSNIHDDAQGTGIVRILNPSDLGNNEFLIWGHNNGIAKATNTIDLPIDVEARFERVWRVNEVNTSGTAIDIGSIDMRWDLNGLGVITASDLRLLIDINNNGVFSDDTPISGAVDLGGGIYEFLSIPGEAITNNSRFTLGTIDVNQTVLPVELFSFKAINIDNKKVKLEWETVSETNIDFFTIERSIDKVNWTVVHTVQGAGNSFMSINYEAFDDNPLPNVSYYRLKQTDFDGHFSYSNIQSVVMEFAKNGYNNRVTIWPNPSDGFVTIETIDLNLSDLTIFNKLGQEITKEVDFISQTLNQAVLDLTRLNEGIYYIKTNSTVSLFYKQK